jgi:DDE superfamily endonuclease
LRSAKLFEPLPVPRQSAFSLHDFGRSSKIVLPGKMLSITKTFWHRDLLQVSTRHICRECVVFLCQVVTPSPPRLVLHIILDGLSAHETTGAQQFLEQHPRVRPYFTPTYSSTLTQVELSFAPDRVRCLRSRLHYLRLRCGPQTSLYMNANFAHALRIPVERLRSSPRIRANASCAIGHQMIK